MGQKISVGVDFIGSFEQMNKGVQDLQKNLSKLNLPLNEQKDFDNLIKSFQKAYGQITSMSKDGTIDIIDEKEFLHQVEKLKKAYRGLFSEIDGLSRISMSKAKQLFPDFFSKEVEQGRQALDKFSKSSKSYERQVATLTQKQEELNTAMANFQKEMGKKVVSNDVISDLNAKLQAAQERLADAKSKLEDFAATNNLKINKTGEISKRSKVDAGIAQQYEDLRKEVVASQKEVTKFNRMLSTKTTAENAATATKGYAETSRAVSDLNTKLQSLKANNEKAFNELVNILTKLNIDTTGIDASADGIETLQKRLLELDNTSLNNLLAEISKLGINGKDLDDIMDQVAAGIRKLGQESNNLRQLNSEARQLEQSFLAFFSATNGVNLFKRAVRSAVETVKELDKTMTEAAVVTEYSINDMWAMMPEYTKRASELGVSINDLYGATTLYLQQGDGKFSEKYGKI